MRTALLLTVIGLAVPVYVYAGYPVLLFLLASCVQMGRDLHYLFRRGERRRRSEKRPFVSVIIAAHNEEGVIADTLARVLASEYPADRMEVLLGSDGSDDGTVEVARRVGGDRVRVLDFRERRGKLAVVTDCVRSARGDLLVFSDANTLLDPAAIRMLVRHFALPHVGAVCGELRLAARDGSPAGEGVYWKIEVILKLLESRLDSTLGANGAIYALRRDLWPALPPRVITEDFVIPMRVRARGFRVVYDPEAFATEEAPARVSDEFRRRVRIGAGNWQALRLCADLLLPWKGFVALAFWSHKLLRWITPFMLPLALAANAFLLEHPFWKGVFIAQVAFYAAALAGAALALAPRLPNPFRTATYFLTINAALALGLVQGVFGRRRGTWQRTARGATPGGGAS